MNRLVRYLDQVKAEGDIKEKTNNYVRNAIEERNGTHTETPAIWGRRNLVMNKLVAAVASIAACALLLIGGYTYYNTPVNYLSFDINPSVELGVNAFDRVVSAEGINADGQALLQQNRFRNMSVEDCLQALVQEAAEQGYVKEDGSTVIALTALSDDNNEAIQLQDRSRDRVQQMVQEQDMDCVVYTDCSNLQIREQARQQDLSPGKYRLISILQALDPSITFDQYRNARITDIIAKANELMQTSRADNAELQRNRAMIMSAAQQIEANQIQSQNRQQNQYQNGNQAGDQQQQQLRMQNRNQDQTGTQSGTQQQNQVQNQYQYQNQTQTGTQSGGEQQQNQLQNQYQNQTSTEEQGQQQTQNKIQAGRS